MVLFFSFSEEEEEEGREGRSMKIVTAKRSRLMEMGSNALDRNVERKREEVLDSSLCYSLLYEGKFLLTLENKRKRKFSMDERRDCGVKGL